MASEKSHLPVSLAPRTLAEAMDFAKMLSESGFVPANYKGKPGDIVAAIQMGAEVGLSPMQALQSIAVINGRPSMWGDAVVGLVQQSGLLVHHKEYFDKDGTAVIEVQRKGDKEIHTVRFSQQQAVKAGLASKQGPWQQYPDRMRMWRARGYAFRDKFADVLKGLITREEAEDYIDITPATEDERYAEADQHRVTELDAAGADLPGDKPKTVEAEVVAPPAGPKASGAAITLNDDEQDLLRKSAKVVGLNPKQFRAWLFEHFALEDESDITADQVAKIQAALEARA
jgi:hypothetical protein